MTALNKLRKHWVLTLLLAAAGLQWKPQATSGAV